MPKLKITLRKSTIGYDKKQRDTVRSLGIKKMHHSVEHEDSPVVRGMIHHVRHLLEVETVHE